MRYEVFETADAQRRLKPDLFGLFRTCFDSELAEAQWEHLYLTSPMGPAASVTAWDDHGLAGHYAFIKHPVMNAQGAFERIARGMTLAVAPRARSQGVFQELLRRTKIVVAEKGLSATLGFPNELSWRPLVLMAGWTIQYESPMLEIECAKVTGECHFEVKAVLPADGMSPPYSSRDFMAWRGRLNPFHSYVVDDSVAIVAKVFRGDTLDVMDAFPLTSPDGNAALRLAKGLGLTRVSITQWHADQIGLDVSGAAPTGYTVRQAIMSNAPGPLPCCRFSLLYSDVY